MKVHYMSIIQITRENDLAKSHPGVGFRVTANCIQLFPGCGRAVLTPLYWVDSSKGVLIEVPRWIGLMDEAISFVKMPNNLHEICL
jgi:hypothetical protein